MTSGDFYCRLTRVRSVTGRVSRVCVLARSHGARQRKRQTDTRLVLCNASKLIFASGRRAYKYSKVGTFGRLVWLIGSPAESLAVWFSLSQRFRFSARQLAHQHVASGKRINAIWPLRRRLLLGNYHLSMMAISGKSFDKKHDKSRKYQ